MVIRALSIASIVSGKPGPVPGAGGNCPLAVAAQMDRNKNKFALTVKRFNSPPRLRLLSGIMHL